MIVQESLVVLVLDILIITMRKGIEGENEQ